MKRLVLLLGLCVACSSCVLAEEISPTDEINSSFSNSKNTNWFIHRMKPKSNIDNITKPQEPKKSLFDKFNSDDKLIKQINDGEGKTDSFNQWVDKKVDVVEPKQKKETVKPKKEPVVKQEKKEKVKKEKPVKEDKSVKKEEPKETVHTTEPAEKVIQAEDKQAAKEEKKQLEQEKQKEQYRELQALTQQYQQAVALYTDNNLDESLAVFSQIPEDKRPAEAWLLMGNILMDKEKKDEAVFMYGRAILTDSKFYKAYYNLGNIYLADEKLNMAVDQYKAASKYAPNNPYIFYNLGCAYLKLGELRKAKSAFIRAVELNSNVADFHYNLAYVYKKLNKEKMARTYLDNYNKLTGQID